jgi:trimethylamine:corrinoid methyltransferase-like protein
MNLMQSYDAAIRATHAAVAHQRQCQGLAFLLLGGCPECRTLENARRFAVTNYYAEAESLTEHPNMLRLR